MNFNHRDTEIFHREHKEIIAQSRFAPIEFTEREA
jgi:hypothetical protein